jgi:sulfatase modifying factor 1
MKTTRRDLCRWRDLLRQVRLLLLLLPILLSIALLHAEVPSLINYQGRLTDAQGQPVTGNRTMAVRVYDAPTGGNMTYEETIGTVEVRNGTYSFRFGSYGSGMIGANETIATTTGTAQIFNGSIQGTPIDGSIGLTDGTYSWTLSNGSSHPSAFGVTYNSTAKSFQIVYWTQTPPAGLKLVATYQANVVQTIDSALANGNAYLALSVNGVEEATRARLLAVPFALKAKESADTQTLREELVKLGLIPPPAGFESAEFVYVQGGTLVTTSGFNGTAVSTFRIGKYEVTWDKWQEVRAWAANNGYSDLANTGLGSAGDHPVYSVSWYDVTKWCNARSEKEGLTPVYYANANVYRSGDFVFGATGNVIANSSANGYRLPTAAEWEWAARGGVLSSNFTYSGSNDLNAVAWYALNSGSGTRISGKKSPNELGIYDMSGNVSEWCVDMYDIYYRYMRGGGWNSGANECAAIYRTYVNPTSVLNYNGFRLARSSGQ